MIKISKLVAMSATIAIAVAIRGVNAQDDLDDLLKQLDTESAKPAAGETAAEKVQPSEAGEPIRRRCAAGRSACRRRCGS